MPSPRAATAQAAAARVTCGDGSRRGRTFLGSSPDTWGQPKAQELSLLGTSQPQALEETTLSCLNPLLFPDTLALLGWRQQPGAAAEQLAGANEHLARHRERLACRARACVSHIPRTMRCISPCCSLPGQRTQHGRPCCLPNPTTTRRATSVYSKSHRKGMWSRGHILSLM